MTTYETDSFYQYVCKGLPHFWSIATLEVYICSWLLHIHHRLLFQQHLGGRRGSKWLWIPFRYSR